MGRLEELFGERTVLFDGAMGSMLYDRGIFINRCYDELNLSQPELVRSIHEEYLQAGAEIIESNTFGANAFRLSHFGLQDKVFAINQAGAKLARQAVAQLADKQAGDAWVGGSIGPLGVLLEPLGKTSLCEARAAFSEQIRGLVAGGVDMLVIETISALNEAEQALLAAAHAAPGVPVLTLVTVDEEANCLDGATCETAATKLTAWGADAIGVNCSAGPATVLTAIERMAAATSLPLSRHAQCRNASRDRGPEHLPLFARVHGEFLEEVSQGGGTVLGWLLRDDAKPYPGDQIGDARGTRPETPGQGRVTRSDCDRNSACTDGRTLEDRTAGGEW